MPMADQNIPPPKSINDLPDEVVCIILGHLPTMRDKLQLGAASHRFDRCLEEHLAMCQWPIQLHFTEAMHKSWRALGVDPNTFCGNILNDMGKRTNFKVICLELDHTDLLESIGEACLFLCQRPKAIAKTNQLSVRYIQKKLLTQLYNDRQSERITALAVHNDKPELPDGFYQLLSKCKLLKQLHLSHVLPCLPKLSTSLNATGLTEISLHACNLVQEPLSRMFQSLKPNNLKTVKLDVTLASENAGGINVASFMYQMSEGPWKAIEILHYNFSIPINLRDFLIMAEFPKLFPKLRHCLPHCSLSFQPIAHHFSECMKRFLEAAEQSPSCPELSVVFGEFCKWQRWTGCQMNTFLQTVMAPSVVRFCSVTEDEKQTTPLMTTHYTVTLGSRHQPSTFKLINVNLKHCGTVFGDELSIYCPYDHFDMPNEDLEHEPCDVCCTLYGETMSKLKNMVYKRQGGHLEHFFLNPCKAQRVAGDLIFHNWKPEVKVSRDQSNGMYTISVGKFQITVESRPCIVPGCVACLENMM